MFKGLFWNCLKYSSHKHFSSKLCKKSSVPECALLLAHCQQICLGRLLPAQTAKVNDWPNEEHLLDPYTVSYILVVPTFQRSVLLSSLGDWSWFKACTWTKFTHLEDRGNTVLWNTVTNKYTTRYKKPKYDHHLNNNRHKNLKTYIHHCCYWTSHINPKSTVIVCWDYDSSKICTDCTEVSGENEVLHIPVGWGTNVFHNYRTV